MYGLVFVAATLAFWRASPVGIVLLMLLCGGDGLADVVGRRLGRTKLPGQADKSWAGSLGFFLGGAVLSLLFVGLFHGLGFFDARWQEAVIPILVTTLVATVVEAYSPTDYDNVTVPAAALLALWLMIPTLGWWRTSFAA